MRSDILYKITIGMLLCCLAIACSDEEWDNPWQGKGVDRNCIVNVKIPFSLSPRLKVDITTRSGATDQTGIDSQLSGIMVFVYENKGDATGATEQRLVYKLFGAPGQETEGANAEFTPDPNDPTQGHFNLHVPAGDVYIYLIGNARNSFVKDVFEEIRQSGEDELKTRQGFLKWVVPEWTGNMDLVAGYLPMAGKVNNTTGACTIVLDHNSTNGNEGYIQYYKNGDTTTPIIIGENGQPFSEDHAFVLSRLMAKVSMKFVNGNSSVTFTPHTYKFYHCSTVIPPIAGFRDSPSSDEVQDTERVPFDVQTPDRFTVYLPENVREYQPTSGKENLTFADRDKVVKDNDGKNQNEPDHADHYNFQYAPKNSTYVEITGRVENTDRDRSANVRYLIHLGDFSAKDPQNPAPDRFNDFNLLRDHHYNYTVTVNGAEDIHVEVGYNNDDNPYNNSEEPNPAVEGVIFEGGARVRLDAHYEQVEMHLQANKFTNGVFIYADTPFGIVHGKYYPSETPGTEGTLAEAADYPNSHTKEQMAELLNWVEFKKQTAPHVLAPYADNATQEKRMNVFDVLDYIYQNADNEGYYTCFVNEYYYEKHPLGGTLTLEDFINASDRTFSLGSDIKYSADGKSAVSKAVYMLQQSSIACFYDLTDRARGKYGVELVDEIGELPYGSPENEGSDSKLGRANSIAELGAKMNTKVVDWEKNGFVLNETDNRYQKPGKERLLTGYQEAYLACLTRNRDEDGDGCISENELRWYTPARDQVLGLWIGEPAMPAEAALYPYPTSQLPGNEGGSEYPVYSSSNGSNRVIYGDESGCFGDINSANGSGYVRIVRNLGKGDFPGETNTYLTNADPYYTYDETNRTIQLHLTSNALRAYTSRELVPHHERDLVNRPYHKFQVAQQPYIIPNSKDYCEGHEGLWSDLPGEFSPEYSKLYTTDATTAKKSALTEAYKYTGTETDISTASWRLPNQRELLLMIVAMGTNFQYTMDAKDFHNMRNECTGNRLLGHVWSLKKNYILHCRTSFSNPNFTQWGYMYNTKDKKMQMLWAKDDFGMGTDGTAGFICVRDVKE